MSEGITEAGCPDGTLFTQVLDFVERCDGQAVDGIFRFEDQFIADGLGGMMIIQREQGWGVETLADKSVDIQPVLGTDQVIELVAELEDAAGELQFLDQALAMRIEGEAGAEDAIRPCRSEEVAFVCGTLYCSALVENAGESYLGMVAEEGRQSIENGFEASLG